MVNTLSQALAWWNNPGPNTHDGGNWAGWCALACYKSLGDPSRPFASNATIAGDMSGPLNPDAYSARPGAFHYWGNGDGHVATDADGGASRLGMASSFVTTRTGNNIGFISFDDYQRSGSVAAPYYRGWSMNYCGTPYAGSDTAGGGGTPIGKDDDIMIRIQSTNRGIALVGAGYYRQLTSDEEVQNSGALISGHYEGNDRQFDLWVTMALDGKAAAPK